MEFEIIFQISLARKRETDYHERMISFVCGIVSEALPNSIVVDVGGVGYEVLVPLSTYDALNPRVGDKIKLKTHLHVRENIQVLYGFATDEERTFFACWWTG